MAEKAGLANYVHFLGRVIGDDLPQIYRTGTLFATASKTETQGIVLLEAMATGLPCIAVDKGAVSDVVKNTKNGYLCQPDDVDEIAKSLVRIITDKDRQKRMSEDSLKRIRQHDISYTLTRFEEIYNKVLDEHDKELWFEPQKPWKIAVLDGYSRFCLCLFRKEATNLVCDLFGALVID